MVVITGPRQCVRESNLIYGINPIIILKKVDSLNKPLKDKAVGLPLKSVQKLQWVQNTAARLLTGADHRDHITRGGIDPVRTGSIEVVVISDLSSEIRLLA